MVAIRVANLDDLPILVEMELKLSLETENLKLDEIVVEKGLKALVVDPTNGCSYVAVDGNEVVGCCLVTCEWSDWRNGVVWWLQSVYVERNHRRQGVFRTMYEYMKNIVDNDSSIKGMRVNVDNKNVIAQKAYTAMGLNGDHYRIFEEMK